MNNFEKRKFLDYLEKLLPVTDTNSYSFDGVFDFMLEEFKMDRKVFLLDEDGELDLESPKKRANFEKILRKEIKLNTRNECANFEEIGGDNNENVVI